MLRRYAEEIQISLARQNEWIEKYNRATTVRNTNDSGFRVQHTSNVKAYFYLKLCGYVKLFYMNNTSLFNYILKKRNINCISTYWKNIIRFIQ